MHLFLHLVLFVEVWLFPCCVGIFLMFAFAVACFKLFFVALPSYLSNLARAHIFNLEMQ